MSTRRTSFGIILVLTVGLKKKPWMKEWFKKRYIFSHENVLKELEISESGCYMNLLRRMFQLIMTYYQWLLR